MSFIRSCKSIIPYFNLKKGQMNAWDYWRARHIINASEFRFSSSSDGLAHDEKGNDPALKSMTFWDEKSKGNRKKFSFEFSHTPPKVISGLFNFGDTRITEIEPDVKAVDLPKDQQYYKASGIIPGLFCGPFDGIVEPVTKVYVRTEKEVTKTVHNTKRVLYSPWLDKLYREMLTEVEKREPVAFKKFRDYHRI
ncbi:MAG: hypothetical protein FWC51_02850 [Proteobacteria bacterium]|nr:hypothetical protein [Pseudomonadota bacterium]